MMLVEDDAMMVRLVTRMLEGEAVAVTEGGCNAAALMIPALWEQVDVALVDLVLQRSNGCDLLHWLALHAPHVRRIAMSGLRAVRHDERVEADVRLLKPFMMDDLLAALRP